jgi:predicted secreted protein
MGVYTGIMVFVVTWWIVIFAVLPWGNNDPPEQVEQGHATSAPARPKLLLKFLVTTIVTAVIWIAIDQAVRHGLVSFRE